ASAPPPSGPKARPPSPPPRAPRAEALSAPRAAPYAPNACRKAGAAASRYDQRCFRTGIGKLGIRLQTRAALGNDHRVRGSKIRGKRFRDVMRRQNTRAADIKAKSSSNRRRSPRLLRIPPVDAAQDITELCRRDRHHAISRARPQEAAP